MLSIERRASGVAQVTMSRPEAFNAFDEAMIADLVAQLEVGPITPEVRERTAATIARVRGTAEANEGTAAFLAKCPPPWSPSA